jgi:WD40 repeat protein
MDGKQLLLYNKEKPSKTPAGTLEGHTAAVLGVTWYKETAFTVSADQTARVWSMKKSKLAGVLRGHAGAVNDVVVSNRHVYTAGQDGSIRLWLNSKWLREEQDGWF